MNPPLKYADLWPLVQADIQGLILADPFLGGRPCVVVEPGDVQSVIDTKLTKVIAEGADGRNGVGFLVLPIEQARDRNSNIPFGPLTLTITVQCCENVPVNNALKGTGIPIRVYAALLEKVLKLYTPVNLVTSLRPANPVISEFTNPGTKQIRIGQVEFEADESDSWPMNRLNRPALSVSGSSYPYTVSVVAPGATQIFFTVDGSHPREGNATAVPYAAPITISGPCLLRVRAFAPKFIASDTQAQNFI